MITNVSKKIFILIFALSLLFVPSIFAGQNKEYRKGEIAYINGKNYVLAANQKFIEILEITNDDKLVKISEVHGVEKVNDMCVVKENKETSVIISTGRYLTKYNITNPYKPEVTLNRDLYEWRRGALRIHSINILACNDKYVFAGGSHGVRRFGIDNLQVQRVYDFDTSYGLAANHTKLALLTSNKGLVYDIESGELIVEISVENKDKNRRSPAIDYLGNVYFISDNSIFKLNNYNHIQRYYNPVAPGQLFSYEADVLPNGNVYYVNGFGISKFEKNFTKTGWFYSAPDAVYGAGSWASGVNVLGLKQGPRVALFNKSSVMLLDGDLKLLDQYKYTSLTSGTDIEELTKLNLIPDKYIASVGDKVAVRVYGFWPNEDLEIKLGKNLIKTKTDNIGYALVELTVPNMDAGITVINAEGLKSGSRYQVSFTVIR